MFIWCAVLGLTAAGFTEFISTNQTKTGNRRQQLTNKEEWENWKLEVAQFPIYACLFAISAWFSTIFALCAWIANVWTNFIFSKAGFCSGK